MNDRDRASMSAGANQSVTGPPGADAPHERARGATAPRARSAFLKGLAIRTKEPVAAEVDER